jgi:hypothetical protein
MPRFTKLFLVGAVLVSSLFAACSAYAESSVQNKLKTNVFFRYGQDNNPKGLQGNAFSVLEEIYKGGSWIAYSGDKFGTLKIMHGHAYLTLVSHEHLTGAQVLYSVPRMNVEVHTGWSGKKPLPLTYKIDGMTAKLLYIDIGIHSNSLSDQTPAPPTTAPTVTTTTPTDTTTAPPATTIVPACTSSTVTSVVAVGSTVSVTSPNTGTTPCVPVAS